MLLFPTQFRQPFSDNFLTFIKSRAPLAHIETSEIQDLRNMVWNIRQEENIKRSLFHYTIGGSLECDYYLDRSETTSESIRQNFNNQERNQKCSVDDFIQRLTTEPSAKDPSKTSIPKGSIIIATGIEGALEDSELGQRLIEVSSNGYLVQNRIALILTDTIMEMPLKLLNYSTPLTYGLPDESCLYATFSEVLLSLEKELAPRHARHKGEFFWYQSVPQIEQLIAVTLGMTTFEAANIYRFCILDTKSPKTTYKDWLPYIYEQKKLTLQKSKALRLIPEEELPKLEEIGGHENYIKFLQIRKRAFTEEAKKFKIKAPRGVVLTGKTGTGKSTIAKVAGRILELPVIALNMGEIYNAYVGVSESRLQQELNRIDAFDGCVLLIDEADKALAGGASDSGTDGGVAMRVFGILLTWLQEHTSKTFVILTMNNTDTVPPELMRAGRFDRVFLCNEPGDTGHKEILQAQMRKHNITDLKLSATEWENLVNRTKGLVGAQLEAIVVEAQYRAFNNRSSGTPTYKELLDSVYHR